MGREGESRLDLITFVPLSAIFTSSSADFLLHISSSDNDLSFPLGLKEIERVGRASEPADFSYVRY